MANQSASTPKTPNPQGKKAQRDALNAAISKRLIDLRQELNLDYQSRPSHRIGRNANMSNGSANNLVPGDPGFHEVGRWVYYKGYPHCGIEYMGQPIPMTSLLNDPELKSYWAMRRMLIPTPTPSTATPKVLPAPRVSEPSSSPLRSSPTPAERAPRPTTAKRARRDSFVDVPSAKKSRVLEVIDISSDDDDEQEESGVLEQEPVAGPSRVQIILLLWRKAKSFPIQVAVDADPHGMVLLGSNENRPRLHAAGVADIGLFRRYVPAQHDWRLSPWEAAFPASLKTKVVAMKWGDIDVFADGCGWSQFKKMFIE
ncbi:hypothetical protein BDZ89DRAFT_1067546 [Hymenopellis radicata]|nr:hypothetical protein BDZ89DRAFT_1067546 [Hymenopellis radicata]